MKIAVIGSGISGLSAAYFLSKKYKVDLFEKDKHFGGHSYTEEIYTDNKNKFNESLKFSRRNSKINKKNELSKI